MKTARCQRSGGQYGKSEQQAEQRCPDTEARGGSFQGGSPLLLLMIHSVFRQYNTYYVN
jgi:hypothetical protein